MTSAISLVERAPSRHHVGLHGPILSATDLTVAAEAALRQGSAIASQIRVPFLVCHVLPEAFSVRVLFPQDAGVDPALKDQLERKAIGAVRVQLDTRVARLADVPVLVARPSPTGGSVLCATDFSDPSLPALHAAAAEAKRRAVRLRVVHCLEIAQMAFQQEAVPPWAAGQWPLPPSVTDRLLTTSREQLDAALATLDVDAEALLLRRSPAIGILEAAQEVATGLIVVGTRGRTGLARLALGSVAEAVMHRAPCSVLVVPLSSESKSD